MESDSISSVASSNIQLQVCVLVVLLVLSSYFSMSETALMALSKIRLRSMVDNGTKNALLVQSVLETPEKLLSAILIGNNLVNIGASSIATSLAITLYGDKGVGIATGILTLIVLIFGEITPKTYAKKNAEKIAGAVIKPMKMCMIAFTPFIFVLNNIAGVFLWLLGVRQEENQPTITESELISMVNVGHEEGVLEMEAREMINNVFDFANNDAHDIMIPRIDVIAVGIEANYEEVTNLFREETFSRMPIYDENIDNIVGIISLKDMLFIDDNKEFSLKDYMREPFFTYETKSVKALFAEMRAKRIPIAIVLDEYGGTSGIVTLEDIIEEIVGEIDDEYDELEQEITEITEGEYTIAGATKIDDVNEMIGSDFKSEDFDSIGGFVMESLGSVPEAGEILEIGHIKIIVEQVEKNRIALVRVITVSDEELEQNMETEK